MSQSTSDPSLPPKAIIIQLCTARQLPQALLNLFSDAEITFCGRCIGGDLAKIGRDFNCASLIFGDLAKRIASRR